MRVQLIHSRTCTFLLSIQSAQFYRQEAGTRRWRHESLLREDAETNASVFQTSIAADVVLTLFGDSGCVLGFADGPEWQFTVDLEKCPYTTDSIRNSMTELAFLFEQMAPWFGDAVFNRGADGLHYRCRFDVPTSVRKHLKRRKHKKG